MICFLGKALMRRWWGAVLSLIILFPILIFWVVLEFFAAANWTSAEGNEFLWWNVLDGIFAAYVLFRTLRFLVSMILINRLRAGNNIFVPEGEG